jgi:hypothetical protein
MKAFVEVSSLVIRLGAEARPQRYSGLCTGVFDGHTFTITGFVNAAPDPSAGLAVIAALRAWGGGILRGKRVRWQREGDEAAPWEEHTL